MRIMLCLLTLCIILSACSLAANGDSDGGISTSTTPTSQTFASSTTPASSTTYPGIREPVTTTASPYMEVSDMDTYNSYLQAGRFPDGFITLEQLPDIGEMTLVKTYTRKYFKNFFTGNYKFLVNKENNYQLTLAVFRDRETYLKGGVDLTGQYSGDLRAITTENANVYICIGGFNFLYRHGVLTGINWVYNGYLYDLFFIQDKIMPLTDETTPFIRDLLHTDTAERAMQTFIASMGAGK